MSIMAQYFRWKSGCTLYSNYGLKDSLLFNSFHDFTDVAKQRSSIICLDEAHNDIDSRSATTNAAKYFSHMTFYLRKMRASLFLSSPSIMNLDSRVRGVTHIYCSVEKRKDRFLYHMYDWQSERFLRTYKIMQNKAFGVAPLVYDTHKMVMPMEFPQKKEEFDAIIHNLRETNDQYYSIQ